MGSSQSHFVTDPSSLIDLKEWDYIVVGAGWSQVGRTLINRWQSCLFDRPTFSSEDEMFSRIPAGMTRLFHTKSDWEYYTSPQSALNMRSVYWPRGKLLGGCSSINAMMYQRAPSQDLDEWEGLGCSGWNAMNLAPYYRKAEKFTPNLLHPHTTHEHHGDSGLWQTGYREPHPNADRFIASCVNAGIPSKNDFNTPEGPIGTTHMISFIDQNGRRSSASTAYLSPAVIARPNLTILLKTYTLKLLFSSAGAHDDPNPKCIGVEVASAEVPPHENETPRYKLFAKKELILCAGAINTPQILMASGIGPDDVLLKAGIPRLVPDAEGLGTHVGRNLSDHLMASAVFRSKDSVDYLNHSKLVLLYLLQHALFGTGPFCTNYTDGVAFLRLDATRELWRSNLSSLSDAPVPDATSGPDAPDIELISIPTTYFRAGSIPIEPGGKSFSILLIHLRPESQGSITVQSGNVFDKAICEPNYLESKVDLQALVRGVRIVLKIARTKPLSDHLVFVDPKEKPNNDMMNMYWLADQDPETLTDKDIENWIRLHAETLYHPTSTARMAGSPSKGVVDPSLRVFGVQNLRICDASVFPNQIAAHPTATIIAMAERLADLILT
ncbi:GMC oxidoreductase [Cantharellus anzutake]|uniref:GMC oxidoreductase n=1 Tax=Cantharellus anzutake TaxID=1750568 RepID=UPI0019080642|nr:GMC oxidoreductase [Cantharellus anzutake]KAF8329771.1 GMC oxidoreductase [Cantharellus anzutake]